jgi:hypothetical protein
MEDGRWKMEAWVLGLAEVDFDAGCRAVGIGGSFE